MSSRDSSITEDEERGGDPGGDRFICPGAEKKLVIGFTPCQAHDIS